MSDIFIYHAAPGSDIVLRGVTAPEAAPPAEPPAPPVEPVAFVNDRDALLQNAPSRLMTESSSAILLSTTANVLRTDAGGTVTPAQAVLNLAVLNLKGSIAYSTVPATLLAVAADKMSATLNTADMTSDVVTVTAKLTTSDGLEYSASQTLVKVSDGAQTYTWIKYADDASGTNFSDSPVGRKYIGLAFNKLTAAESSTPGDYAWSLIKGDQGIPGPAGYMWLKYADDVAGTGITDDPTDKAFIGIAHNKTTEVESTNPADYVWSRIQGNQGVPGLRGAGHFYATAGVWSDAAAAAACPNGTPVFNDVVTITSPDKTYIMEKMYLSPGWQALATVVDGNLLVTGSVKTAALAALAVTADKVAAGAITTNKMLVTSKGDCINDDPFLEDLSAWAIPAGVTHGTNTSAANASGNNFFTVTSGTDKQVFSARKFAIDPAKTYSLTANLYAAGGNARNMYIIVQFYDAVGTAITNTGWGGTYSGYTFGGLPPTGAWSRQGGQFGPGTGRLIPVGVRSCSIGVWFQYAGTGSGNVEQAAQDIRLQQAVDDALVVDGGIKARHLQVATLSAISVDVGTLTSRVNGGAGTTIIKDQIAIYDESGQIRQLDGRLW